MILQKCEQENCKGLIVACAYIGKDALQRVVVQVVCSEKHNYQVFLPIGEPLEAKRTLEFPPKKGEWFADQTGGIVLGCPGCGKMAGVSAPVHSILASGEVKPSWTCPYGCGWHNFVTLEDYQPIASALERLDVKP